MYLIFLIFSSSPPAKNPKAKENIIIIFPNSAYHHIEKLEILVFRISNSDFNIVRNILDNAKGCRPSCVVEETLVSFITACARSRNHLSSVECYYARIFSHSQFVDVLAGRLDYLHRYFLFFRFVFRVVVFIFVFAITIFALRIKPINFSLVLRLACFLCDLYCSLRNL